MILCGTLVDTHSRNINNTTVFHFGHSRVLEIWPIRVMGEVRFGAREVGVISLCCMCMANWCCAWMEICCW